MKLEITRVTNAKAKPTLARFFSSDLPDAFLHSFQGDETENYG
jgi:hypothetical protein